ncbi:MAG: hypothetical protein IT473_10330, partial [Lysobacter sp.]|nr:hypothetical protein [Lysobacter sp.]
SLKSIVARRKELKNIASGLLGSFISRNNDVAGYWGIGQLSSLAAKNSVDSVRIDLILGSITPPNAFFSELVSGYSRILNQRLLACDIPPPWLRSATIELNLNPEPPPKRVFSTTWGSLFELTVTLVDDKFTEHAVSAFGYCAPHDPIREYRRPGGWRF